MNLCYGFTMNTRRIGPPAAAIGLFLLPAASAEAVPRDETSYSRQMNGTECGPAYIEGEAVDHNLVAAVANLGRTTLASQQEQGTYPQVDLHVHYLKGGAAHDVLSDSGFDKYINDVAIHCVFDESDVLLTLVKYTDRERADYNRRFGYLDLSTRNYSPLGILYNANFSDVQARLSANLADKSTPEQADLTDAVKQLEQIYLEAINELQQQPSTPNNRPEDVEKKPNATAEWLKENWSYLGEGLVGLSITGLAGTWLMRKRRMKGEVAAFATGSDNLLRQSYDLLKGKQVTGFGTSLRESSYPASQQLAEPGIKNYTANDSNERAGVQDAATTTLEPEEDEGVALLGDLTNYQAFRAMFGPDKDASAESMVADLLSDPEIQSLWEARTHLLEAARTMVTDFGRLKGLSKEFWPSSEQYGSFGEQLKRSQQAVADLLADYEAKFNACQRAAGQSSERFQALSEKLLASIGTLDTLKSNGWDVAPLETEYKRHNDFVGEMQQKTFKQPIAASVEAGEYVDALTEFCTECASYENRFKENKRLQDARADTLARLDADTAEAADTLSGLRPSAPDGYDKSCTKDIDTYDKDMSGTLKYLKKAQEELGRKLDVKSVDMVRTVEKDAAEFVASVAQVDSLAAQIASRRDRLAALKESMPALVASLKVKLTSHIDRVTDWGIDVDFYVLNDLRSKHGLIDELKRGLDKQQPEYLKLEKDLDAMSRYLFPEHPVHHAWALA
jgi:hypothetical protein